MFLLKKYLQKFLQKLVRCGECELTLGFRFYHIMEYFRRYIYHCKKRISIMIMEVQKRTRQCILLWVLIAQTLTLSVLPVTTQLTSSTVPGYTFSQGDLVSIDVSDDSQVLLQASKYGLTLFKRSSTEAKYNKADSLNATGVTKAVVSPSGGEAAVLYEVGGVSSLKVFDISNLNLSNSYNADIPAGTNITALEYLTNDKLIVGLSDGKVASFTKNPPANSYSIWKPVPFHQSKVLSLASNGTTFLSTSASQAIWGTLGNDQAPVVGQTLSKNSISTGAISPNGKRAFLGYQSGNTELIGDLNVTTSEVTSFPGQVVKSNSDGSQYAALSTTGILRIWGRNDNDLGKSDTELADVVAFAWTAYGEIYTIRAVSDADQGQLYSVVFDCASVDNSISTTYLVKCECKTDYYFNDNVCNRNCSLKPLEDGTNYDKDTCNCKGLATFTNSNCQLQCSTDSNANPGTTTTGCTCVTGYYWGQAAALCTINCSLVAHSQNKTMNGSVTSCSCSLNYTWLDTACVVDCSLIPNADALNTSTSCTCDEGYAWSNGTCIIDCSVDEYSTGTYANEACECKAGYFWSNGACTLNCSNVKYTASTYNPSAGECECTSGFDGDLTTGVFICKPLCTEQVGAKGYSDTGLECTCKTGYKWSELGCIVDCSTVLYSTGLNDPADPMACGCKSGYVSVDSSCYLDCSVNEFSYDLYTNNTKCNCTTNAISSQTSKVCAQNCATLANANATKGTNANGQCYCKDGYYYVNHQCVRNCTIDNRSDYTNLDLNTCNCLENYTWNSKQCFTDCSKVANSYGYISTKLDSCTCSDGYSWNGTGEICVKSSDGGSSGVAIGLGVGLGVGIPVLIGALVGVYFLFKKRTSVSSPAPYTQSPYYQPAAQTAATFPTIPNTPAVVQPLGQSIAAPLGQSIAGQSFYPLAQSNALGQSFNRSQATQNMNTCMVCQGPEANMLTSCGHRFHVQCMMTKMRQIDKGCPACGYKNFYVLKGEM